MNMYTQGNEQKSGGPAIHADPGMEKAFGVMNPVPKRTAFCPPFGRSRRIMAFRVAVTRCILFLFLSCVLSVSSAQDDIFATPSQKSADANPYPTGAALFAATKSGEIPEALHADNLKKEDLLEPAVFKILVKEYGFNPAHRSGFTQNSMLVLLLRNLTDYEFGGHQPRDLEVFHYNQDGVFGSPEDKGNRSFEDSRAAFNKFAADYDKALKEYLAAKKEGENQRKTAAAADRRRTIAEAKQMEEEHRQKQEAADAQAASVKAEEAIKNAAVSDALEKAKSTREQKLKACLASPAYKLWETALQVQQGEAMIAKAQRLLEHDDNVQGESGVTDLSVRRAAGEQIVAGRGLVESAFENYKKLGGKAVAPDEVIPGPDPAAQYR